MMSLLTKYTLLKIFSIYVAGSGRNLKPTLWDTTDHNKCASVHNTVVIRLAIFFLIFTCLTRNIEKYFL